MRSTDVHRRGPLHFEHRPQPRKWRCHPSMGYATPHQLRARLRDRYRRPRLAVEACPRVFHQCDRSVATTERTAAVLLKYRDLSQILQTLEEIRPHEADPGSRWKSPHKADQRDLAALPLSDERFLTWELAKATDSGRHWSCRGSQARVLRA